MSPILAGQLRHVVTLAGGAVAGTGAATDSLEAALGGLVLAALGHLWSWLSKRAR
jgi:hypothetical protein